MTEGSERVVKIKYHGPIVNQDFIGDGISFLKIVDYMGSDDFIADRAGSSYDKRTSSTESLIRRLWRHKHTSPFEMCEVVFHIRLPNSTAKQLIRHRTASLNEFSTRYRTVKEDLFYVPEAETVALQSEINKQGRADSALSSEESSFISNIMRESMEESFKAYDRLIKLGVAREIARGVLPVDFYTEMYWKIDLHNLLKFLTLRLAPDAQYEIRKLAEAMMRVVMELFPITGRAFLNYTVDARTFSESETETILGVVYDRVKEENPDYKNREHGFVWAVATSKFLTKLAIKNLSKISYEIVSNCKISGFVEDTETEYVEFAEKVSFEAAKHFLTDFRKKRVKEVVRVLYNRIKDTPRNMPTKEEIEQMFYEALTSNVS